ncbi:MAG: sulfite dehydrogenase [Gemmatimonadaceae bacterium]
MTTPTQEQQHASGPPSPPAPGADAHLSRRDLLAGMAGAVGGALVAGVPALASGQAKGATPPVPGSTSGATPGGAAAATQARPVVPADPTKVIGSPTTAVGSRTPFFTPARNPNGDTVGSSLTPLEKLTGTVTPSDLHFERHHAGIPAIDPERHALMIHGLVDRPMVFTLDEVKRFPQVTRTHFIECSGNGRAGYRDPKPELTPQKVAGMSSNTEWIGVPLATLMREVGVHDDATWFLAEGGDACLMTRSVPIAKGWDDALVVWAQNGEPLRPEQGYPLRLLLPGWEGNINIKWLRRLEFGTRPWMTRWETSKYTDPLPNGTARQFSFEVDARSIITSPAYPDRMASPGWRPISGLAWSGRGRIRAVEVSVDGGTSWHAAELLTAPLPKAHVRFQYMWNWTGGEHVLLSRAIDETGYIQPTRTALIAARGIGTDYHYNNIVGARVATDGSVTFFGDT